MILFNAIIIIVILVFVWLDVSWQELRRSIFLEGVIGLTFIMKICIALK